MLYAILAGLLVINILRWLYHRYQRFQTWRQFGIPGPKPSFFHGNLKDIVDNPIRTLGKWFERYGRTVGYYEGARLTLVTTDVDLAKQVLIKDFDKFADRPDIVPGSDPGHNVLFVKGIRWREQRSILTPSFTSAKLKGTVNIMKSAIADMIDIIDKEANTDLGLDIYPHFQGLTMDVIGRTAFGIQSNAQKDPQDPFLEGARKMLSRSYNQNILFALLICFPEFHWILRPIRRIYDKVRTAFKISQVPLLMSLAKEVVNKRRSDPTLKRPDLIQLMVDAQMTEEQIKATSKHLAISSDMAEEDGQHHETANDEARNIIKKHLSLTEEEIIANAFIFFIAGYHTTSTALGFIAHILVNHQDVQGKIRADVFELLEKEGSLDYNTVTKLEYMESVIYETLRIYPVVFLFTSRESLTDYEYNGIKIPKGTKFTVSTYHLHHDAEYWKDPEEFDPSRFSREARRSMNPVLWQPFGAGPRNCIGMRLALLEIKLTLAQLLVKYCLVPSEKTEIGKLTLDIRPSSIAPKNGIHIRLERI